MRKKKSHSPSVSLVINTKNEERHIAGCIKSAGSLADEILIVDMHSTDRTVAIAKQLGARVITVKDSGFVETARQTGINTAKGEWILIIDADSRYSPSLRKALTAHITASTADVVRVPRKTMFCNRWLKHGNYWPDYQVRLFKKGTIEWPKVIHTQPIISPTATVLDLPAEEAYAITHYHGTSIAQLAQKMATQSQHERYYESLPAVRAQDMHHMITYEFQSRYFTHKGYLDGVAGFVATKLREYYEFLEFAYYWQRQGFPETMDPLELSALWQENKGTAQALENMRIESQQQASRINTLENELAIIRDSKFYQLYRIYQKIKAFVGIGRS